MLTEQDEALFLSAQKTPEFSKDLAPCTRLVSTGLQPFKHRSCAFCLKGFCVALVQHSWSDGVAADGITKKLQTAS